MGGIASLVQPEKEFSYSELPGFPVSKVTSHAGKLIIGKLDGITTAILQGRSHYYEGVDMKALGFGGRIADPASISVNDVIAPIFFPVFRHFYLPIDNRMDYAVPNAQYRVFVFPFLEMTFMALKVSHVARRASISRGA